MKLILKLLFTNAACLCSVISFAQQTITISGTDLQDAMLYRNLRPGYEYTVSTNYGNHPRIAAVAWSASGYNSSMRTLLSFNLAGIPTGSTVQSATLYLYSDPTITGSSDANGNSQLSGSNAIYLEKVIAPWNEHSVTWNNQPATTTTGRVWIGPSVSTTANVQINLVSFVQGWVNDPTSNKGLKIILENEIKYRSRNYASKNHSNSAIRPKLIVSYVPPTGQNSTVFQDEMNVIFQNVNRAPVTTGLLKDYGLLMADVNKFDGTLKSNNLVNRSVFTSIYSSLYFMKFNSNATLASPAVLNNTLQSYQTTTGGLPVNNIIALHYNFEQFKADALTNNLVYVSYGKIYDTPNRPTTPYEIKSVFAMGPAEDDLNGNNHVFKFRNELFFGNINKTISSVQIDFDDGLGYRSITMGSDISIAYNSDGRKDLVFKITYTDGQALESKSVINVRNVSRTCSSCRYTGLPQRVEFPVSAFPVPLANMGTAQGVIYYGGTDRILDRPVIIAEGFDPQNEFNELFLFDLDFLGQEISPGLTLEEALDNDYDLVFVNYGNGGDAIQRNAFVLENIIQWVNQQKATAGSIQRNVVIGVSMGCLVARYALRDMELRGVNHDTRLYVSFDGPHLGANVPLGFQAAVRYLSGIQLFGISPVDTAPELLDAVGALNSPAATQMLTYQLTGTGPNLTLNPNPYAAFMAEYNTNLGMPTLWNVRNIAIANGSECGVNQGFSPYAQMLTADDHMDINYFINLLVGVVQFAGSGNPFRFLEGFISTNTDLRLDIDVRSLPDQQALRIFYLRLSYHKEILFGAITSTQDLFNFSFNSTANMLPLDNAPGGSFDIDDFGTIPTNIEDFDLNPMQTSFSFIPTTSALNIGAGTQTILGSDLARAYSPAFPPGAPKNVPFNNFFTNPVVNEHHVQFTTNNAQWLWQEIQGTSAFFSCSYLCSGTPIALSINGPASLCSAETYTLQNVPPGATISWTHSSNLTYVSGQGTFNYRVSRNGSGDSFVQAVVAGECGSSSAVRMNITGGVSYSSSDYPVTGPSNVCINQYAYYSTNSLPLATNYSWFWPSSWQYAAGQGTRFLDLYVSSSSTSGAIGVRVATACDAGGSPATIFASVSTCGSFMMAAYPNPAQSELVIEPTGTDSSLQADSVNREKELRFTAKLFDYSGELRKSGNSSGEKLTMKIDDLSDGQYFLHVTTDIETVVSQVVIKR